MAATRSRASVRPAIWLCAALTAGAALFAQPDFFRGGRGGGGGGGGIWVPEGTRTAREIPTRSTGTPMWDYQRAFKTDVFTFARLRYDRVSTMPIRGWGTRGGWTTDLPDADLNLSYRLQQMTAIKVDPDSRLLRATDPDLPNFPFLFIAAPGALALSPPEVTALRNYLRNGGFILMTDYWGDEAEANVNRVFRDILPESHFEELPIEHP